MRKTEDAKGRGCNSKNGAVAENPSVRSSPPSSKCPKCGSEMRYFDRFAAWRHKEPIYGPGPDDYGRIRYYRCVKCGHEERLGGEKVGGRKGGTVLKCPKCGKYHSSSQCSPRGKKFCPKCGSELPLEEGWDGMVYHCRPCHIVIDAETDEACEIRVLERLYPLPDHEEKLKDGEKG